MKQEDKKLLLKDLCARLPYGVKIELTWWVMWAEGCCKKGITTTLELDHIEQLLKNKEGDIEIKPYLRPLPSMTDEERVERIEILYEHEGHLNAYITYKYQDWLNAHHFDYRGLIEKGLAIEAPKDMYN